uniref:Uncharacterized protein n=1 Tax=Rhizophora mucronata TaxID=61149 RepID=A0A2P2PL98_RHIMU
MHQECCRMMKNFSLKSHHRHQKLSKIWSTKSVSRCARYGWHILNCNTSPGSNFMVIHLFNFSFCFLYIYQY